MHASGALGDEPGPPAKRDRFAGAARSGAATRQSILPTVRTLVLQAHRWTGLTVGLVLVFMAISVTVAGCALRTADAWLGVKCAT